MKKIIIYDTTLRDGTQSKEINLTVQDKLTLLKYLDSIKIPYAELGWPGSNPKDMEAFLAAEKLELHHTKISAFCSTKRKNILAKDDPNLQAVISSKARVACIFGKTWIDHIEKQLQITPEENLNGIFTSIQFLVENTIEVFFDAEHFFDGFKDNQKYALECIKTAQSAGATSIILCDTNGGSLPEEIATIVEKVKTTFPHMSLGIHVHNDGGCAVANSIIAAEYLDQIQGTINGIGERCGNADLCQIIPALKLKKNIATEIVLEELKKISDILYILANVTPPKNQPYVGDNAFAHKGGIHVDAISKGAIYEHITPEKVGNKQHIVLSDLSGTANIVEIVKKYGITVDKKDLRVKQMLEKVKQLEMEGYNIGDIDAEQYLLVNEFFIQKETFDIKDWEVSTKKIDNKEYSECTIVIQLPEIIKDTNKNEEYTITKEVEDGPVDAIYKAMQAAISKKYPLIQLVQLINFKVMIAQAKGVESSVRVYIEFCINGIKSKSDKKVQSQEFATSGVSTNILEASVEAIKKGFQYAIIKKSEYNY